LQRGRHILGALGVSWLSLVVTVVVQLVQVPVALAHLSNAEFSLFAIFSQLLGYLFVVDFGASAAFTRLIIDAQSRDRDTYAQVWTSGLLLLVAQAAVMLAVVSAATPALPWLFKLPPSLASEGCQVFWFLGAILAVRQATVIVALNMWAAQKLALANSIQLAASLAQFGVFVAAVPSIGLWAYVASMAVGTLLPHGVYALVVHHDRLLPRVRWTNASWPHVRQILSLGADALWITFFGIFVNASFLVFAGLVLPLDQVAALSVNLKPIQLFTEAVRRIAQTCEPYFAYLISAGDLGRFRFGWALAGKTMAFLSLLGGVSYAIVAPWIISAWTSSDYIMNGPVLALLCLVPLRQVAHVQAINPLFQFMAMKPLRLPLLLEAAMFGAAAWALGRGYGAAGLMAAYFIALPLGAWFPGLRALARASGIGRSDMLAIVRGPFLIMAVVAVLILLFLPRIHSGPWYTAAGLALLFGGGGGLLFALAGLRPEEKAYAINLVRGSRGGPAGS
jgi:O-antigen/teichoic acid export membrane protein